MGGLKFTIREVYIYNYEGMVQGLSYMLHGMSLTSLNVLVHHTHFINRIHEAFCRIPKHYNVHVCAITCSIYMFYEPIQLNSIYHWHWH